MFDLEEFNEEDERNLCDYLLLPYDEPINKIESPLTEKQLALIEELAESNSSLEECDVKRKPTKEEAAENARINEVFILDLMKSGIFSEVIKILLVDKLHLSTSSIAYKSLSIAIPYALFVDKHIIYVIKQVAHLLGNKPDTVYKCFTRCFKNSLRREAINELRFNINNDSNECSFTNEVCLHILCLNFYYQYNNLKFKRVKFAEFSGDKSFIFPEYKPGTGPIFHANNHQYKRFDMSYWCQKIIK